MKTDNSPIITNHALAKMKAGGLSEAAVLDAFNKRTEESASFGGRWNAVRKYSDYEIGVNYDRRAEVVSKLHHGCRFLAEISFLP